MTLFSETPEWYQVECTVWNKTDQRLNMYFGFDTSIDGAETEDIIAILLPVDAAEVGFIPDAASQGLIVFTTALPDNRVTNFSGTLVVYDEVTREPIGDYPFSIKEL
jgi:hypothetical protein